MAYVVKRIFKKITDEPNETTSEVVEWRKREIKDRQQEQMC